MFLFCVRGESRRKIKRLTKCLAFLTLLLTPPESLMGKQSNEARFMRRVSDGGPRPNKNFQFCLFCFEIPRLTGAFRFLHRFETQFTLCTSPAFRSSAVLTPSISQRPSLTRVYRGLIIVIVAGEEPSYHTPSASVWILRFFLQLHVSMWSPSENFLFFPDDPRHPPPSTYPITSADQSAGCSTRHRKPSRFSFIGMRRRQKYFADTTIQTKTSPSFQNFTFSSLFTEFPGARTSP